MSFKNSFIVSLVFVLGVVFLVLSVPQDSRAGLVAIPIESDCCDSHGGAGCDDDSCEDFICSFDPFCCDSNWDGQCADEANEFCAVCGAAGITRPIPTLNQWGLIALAGIMGLAALYILIRRRPFESS